VSRWNCCKALASLSRRLPRAKDVRGRCSAAGLWLTDAEADKRRRFSTENCKSSSTSLESLNALLAPSSLIMNPWALPERMDAAV
jgi:hypothetical protein